MRHLDFGINFVPFFFVMAIVSAMAARLWFRLSLAKSSTIGLVVLAALHFSVRLIFWVLERRS